MSHSQVIQGLKGGTSFFIPLFIFLLPSSYISIARLSFQYSSSPFFHHPLHSVQFFLVTSSRPHPKQNRLFPTGSGHSRSRWSCPQFQHPVTLPFSHSTSPSVRGSEITGRGSGNREEVGRNPFGGSVGCLLS